MLATLLRPDRGSVKVSVKSPTLDEVFLTLTGHQTEATTTLEN